jgi:hypothetical protein
LEQAEEELLESRKIHRQFNPALLDGRWSSLWPEKGTATVITTEALWEKFARQGDSPILAGEHVLKAMIRSGVEQDIFGYGLLIDDRRDKLDPASYEGERVYLGPFDARDLVAVEIGPRGVLMRPAQVDALFPPVTKEEVAMVLRGPRQSVDEVFHATREKPTVEGRVDKNAFLVAVCEGAHFSDAAGFFGYAEIADGAVVRGADADLSPDDVHFSGWLIGEEVPLPVTAEEVARLVPGEGKVPVQELYQQALEAYGAERVSEQGLLNALGRCVRGDAGYPQARFGYADSADALVRPGATVVTMEGYVGPPEELPPDTRLIRLHGTVSPMSLANVMKTAISLSKLSEEEASIALELSLELKGEVNEHAVKMALREIQKRVAGLVVKDV